MLARAVLGSAVALAFFGCSGTEVTSASDAGPPGLGGTPIIPTPDASDEGAILPLANCTGDELQSSLTVTSSYVVGSTLVAHTQYGGGCQKHEMHACWGSTYLLSVPGQTAVTIWQTSAQPDTCEALISTTVTVDISSLNPSVIVVTSPPAQSPGDSMFWGPGAPYLGGQTFALNVDQKCDRSSITGPPLEPIPDALYAAVQTSIAYTVAFSADATSITVTPIAGGSPITGQRIVVTAGGAISYSYDLDRFAGGRLWVGYRDNEMRAELVLYGSGVPVTTCDRGALEQPGYVPGCRSPEPGPDGGTSAACPCYPIGTRLAGPCSELGDRCVYPSASCSGHADCICEMHEGAPVWSCYESTC